MTKPTGELNDELPPDPSSPALGTDLSGCTRPGGCACKPFDPGNCGWLSRPDVAASPRVGLDLDAIEALPIWRGEAWLNDHVVLSFDERDALVAAVRDRDRQIEAVRALHRPLPLRHGRTGELLGTGCAECRERSSCPCPTIRALDGGR